MLIPWVPTSSITWCFLHAAMMMIYNQLFRGKGQKVVFLSFIKAVSLFNNHVPFISRLADHADLLHYMLVPHYLGTPPHRWIFSLYDSNTQLKDDSSIRSIRSSSCYHAGEFHHGHGFSSQFYPIIGFQFKSKVTGIVMKPKYLSLSEPKKKLYLCFPTFPWIFRSTYFCGG